jgi:O-antigen ligase
MRAVSTINQQIFIFALLSFLCVGGAFAISRASLPTALLLAFVLLASSVAFIRSEIAIYMLIVAMLLSPEMALGHEVSARAGKGVTLRMDDVLLVIVGLAWFIKSAVNKELNLVAHTRLNMPVFLYAFACVLSTLLGMQAGRVELAGGGLFVIKYIEYFVLFWMVVNGTHDRNQVRRYVMVLFAVAVIVAAIAISQIPNNHRVSAPFQGEHGEPNTLGGYLVFIIALMLGLVVTSARHRFILLVSIGLLSVPLVYTLSRSSYLAVAPAVLTVFLMARKPWYIAAVLILLLLVLLAPSRFLPQAVMNRIEFTVKQESKEGVILLGRRVDTSTSARIASFTYAVGAFQQKPVFGWGVTGWRFIDSQYFRTLVETGLFGFSMFLFLIYRIWREGLHTWAFFRDKDDFCYGLSCGFVGGLVGLLVHAIGANTFIIVRVMEPFWLLCGIIYILPRLAGTSEPHPVESRR